MPRKKSVLPTGGDELQELRKRANEVQRDARAGVTLSTRVRVDTYKQIVEVAETEHRPVAEVVRTCLLDGLRRHTEFAGAWHDGAAVPATPGRAYVDSLTDPARYSPPRARDVRAQTLHDFDQRADAEDPALQASLALQARAYDLAAPLPSGGPPPPSYQDDDVELPLEPAAE